MDENEEPVQESAIPYSQGSFIIELIDYGYISVNPEYLPGGTPSGRFHCYMMDPIRGSSTFYLSQNDNMVWSAEVKPPYLKEEMIQNIGQEIENHDA